MATLQFFRTKAEATKVIGSLSNTSKMPGKSWGISAALCKTGSKLACIDGTICADCYACKNAYVMYPAVAKAHATRINAWKNDRLAWCQAMVDLIGRESHFRWFDSGDIQSADMLRDILAVAARTPNTKHWIATREVGFVRDALAGKTIPDNVVIRMSASFPDSSHVPGASLTGTVALVHTSQAQDGAYACPAPLQGNACCNCRACWSRDVAAVSYKSH